jgi:hypothetical protein
MRWVFLFYFVCFVASVGSLLRILKNLTYVSLYLLKQKLIDRKKSGDDLETMSEAIKENGEIKKEDEV